MNMRTTASVRLLSGDKEPVRLASTANLALVGLLTVDGVVTVPGDRVLVKDQTDATKNGIYTASEGTWYRATDAKTSRAITKGVKVHVQSGTVNANRVYAFDVISPDIGDDAITISMYFSATIVAEITALLDGATGVVASGSWIQSGTGAVSRSVQNRLREIVSVMDFGAVGDGVTDDTAAIQAAADYLDGTSHGYGAVCIPRGDYKITTAIAVPVGISFFGEPGMGSRISPVACSAFTFAFTTGFGDSTIRDLSIEGTNCTTQVGIYQPGTLNNADELYKITIQNVKLRNYNIGIKFRTVRNVTIENCWLQDVNSGIHLVGQCLVVNINECQIVFAAGCGAGAQYGILTQAFNYTSGTGSVQPEGVRISKTTVYGFNYGIAFENVIYGDAISCDVQAKVEGIRWIDARSVLNITGNYVQVASATAGAAVRGVQLAAEADGKINIAGNRIESESVGAALTYGVLLAIPGNGNVNNVTIAQNTFNNNTQYDIAVYGSANIQIRDNWCRSSVAIGILVSAIPSASGGFVYVDGNRVDGSISRDSADENAGLFRAGINTVAGVREYGTPLRTGAATPQGSVTSLFAGQEFYDSVAGKFYKAATGGVNNAWLILN